MNKYICIHGHFYQPPRENAWLEEVELQDSAHPYHDWNERISSECYAPNTASRILNEEGVIENIVNNYSRISFNFGPTLLSWLEKKEPETYEAILEADVKSRGRFSGHGSAMAQVYNHMILPLANRKDKETQVIWGIKDFERRFQRFPEGMWLAETAVDTESLEVMAEQGIKFTILAPRQAKAFRKIGSTQWTDISNSAIDPKRPYLYRLPSGKTINLFFYDGNISQGVAFNNLLSNGANFSSALMGGFNENSKESQLVHIATDGESYGHHHRHGDMALAFCLYHIESKKIAKLTNYGEYLEKYPPVYEAQILEDSSWSCIHGVGRWKENCGCHSGGRSDWNQEWRKPLRESLDWLRDHLANVFETEGKGVLKDPWQARNDFIHVILNRKESVIEHFLEEHAVGPDKKSKALILLEMQRNAQLMYTSCGWFFDEVSGIETTQILQYACRAAQLARDLGAYDYEPDFIKMLKSAPSNIPEHGNAASVYKKFVVPTMLDLQRVGMHHAVASIFEEDPESFPIFNYTTNNRFFERKIGGVQRLVMGITRIQSIVTLTESEFSFAVLYLGQHNIIGNISMEMETEEFYEMRDSLSSAFDESRLGDMIGIMQRYFGPDKYTLWHLFRDEKRKVLNQIMQGNMIQLENSFRRIYNRDYQLINTLKSDNIPIPNAYKTTLEFVLNTDLMRCLSAEDIDPNELSRIAFEFEKWDLNLDDSLSLAQYAGQSIYKGLRKIVEDMGNVSHIMRLNEFFELMQRFFLQLDLYRSQNLYFKIVKERRLNAEHYVQDPTWEEHFARLGKNLGVK